MRVSDVAPGELVAATGSKSPSRSQVVPDASVYSDCLAKLYRVIEQVQSQEVLLNSAAKKVEKFKQKAYKLQV